MVSVIKDWHLYYFFCPVSSHWGSNSTFFIQHI